jgi:hypothetical protein
LRVGVPFEALDVHSDLSSSPIPRHSISAHTVDWLLRRVVDHDLAIYSIKAQPPADLGDRMMRWLWLSLRGWYEAQGVPNANVAAADTMVHIELFRTRRDAEEKRPIHACFEVGAFAEGPLGWPDDTLMAAIRRHVFGEPSAAECTSVVA